jgi:hypothetical protein
MFSGQYLGFNDSNNKPVHCGDRVRFTRHTGGTLVTTIEDGWGRDIPLAKDEYFTEPTKIETIEGVIIYSVNQAAFFVLVDGTRNFYSLTRYERYPKKEDKFEIIGK